MSFDGLLNRTCTIETRTQAQDSSGEMIETWATAGIAKCRVCTYGGGRVDIPNKIYEDISHIIFMRDPGISLTVDSERLDIDGSKYTILLIKELYSTTDLTHLELMVKVLK